MLINHFLCGLLVLVAVMSVRTIREQEMFKKIKRIKNVAVYSDFDWDASVRESGGRISEFKGINIIYGRNYSGKTTLSRIFRSLETGFISDKYISPKFEFELSAGGVVNQDQIPLKQHKVRVFNEDFVRENLKFISNADESIKSFAILGEDNNRLEEEIKLKEEALGSEEDGVGKLGVEKEKKLALGVARKNAQDAQDSLDSKISDKANNKNTGIKHNKIYGEATYNAPKLLKDVETVLDDGFECVSDDESLNLEALLKEEVKAEIDKFYFFEPSFDKLSSRAKDLVEKKISVTQPLIELLEDNLLEDWVRKGRALHEHKRDDCGFCGGALPSGLWSKLDLHFNKESEELRISISSLLFDLQNEIKRAADVPKIDVSSFYASFRVEVLSAEVEINSTLNNYRKSLEKLGAALDARLADIFHPKVYFDVEDYSEVVVAIGEDLNGVVSKSNEFTKTLATEKNKAQKCLRLRDVFRFVMDINLGGEKAKIIALNTCSDDAEREWRDSKLEVDVLVRELDKLKAQLKDESKGADRVNVYLNDFFGHKALSLKSEEVETGYKFEVVRNGVKAHHLSEGECSLIAFCYFMAKLHDVETKGHKPVIYIDDPISSLDSNHIFFIFGLINSEIVRSGEFGQLFVSTHNLDFLKYLKRLIPKDVSGKAEERRYFIIETSGDISSIKLMPGYLKSYVTEFNYLFHQIFKCANAGDAPAESEHDCYYNYGNNARKFLEAFLYYKYPNADEKDSTKLERFFGDDSRSSLLTERIHNEYSHLAGVFERSISPVDVPEMKRSAQFILNKMKEKDADQYSAFMESIGNPVVTF
jgi:wobble nucleotide-excising tRNase